ncbi:hypothetical protein VK792_03140 [Mesobacterium sp. TK19101]|uniref:Uncharacterized protein n=1 Tax=Mesobacterium hydrothermale TaxID=3111907 RepID=A0ABU6HCR9_9RHOB|nr:hypothetical protein [Mesobacterium sp. TK19101]MEC3860267.1 hypothetical protein [Mesobacterium sp. TK19101]
MAMLSANSPQGPGIPARIAIGLAGLALMIAAVGLWLTPGLDPFPEVSLMKLGLSLFMALGGWGLTAMARLRRI